MVYGSPFYRNIGFSLLVALGLFGLSCGNDSISSSAFNPVSPKTQPLTEVDQACASDIFLYGRRITFADLKNSGHSKYALESVYFRDVISRSSNDVELAYRVKMNMRLDGRTLVPDHVLECHVKRQPSRRTLGMSRTTIPILGDLHLPSTRITIFDTKENGDFEDRNRLYNFPRISDLSISSDNYFSFTQNPAGYRSVTALSDYLELLRFRSLFSRIELREMGYGRIGIFAEKDYAGERVQLLIILVERNQ